MHEYKVVSHIGKKANEELESELNNTAKQGWDLITIVRDIGYVQSIWKKEKGGCEGGGCGGSCGGKC